MKEQTTIEMARVVRKSLVMISKVEDDHKLIARKNAIDDALPLIKARINEIKSEGKSSSEVVVQRQLYFEGTELESLRDEIEGKKDAINDKLDNLSPKQKTWFGIEDDDADSDDGDENTTSEDEKDE
tara:strand:- start:1528 stop:1908 length:381 start_codon:yes stop_codon:yes gene_type:complete